jgi:hypothetical protein
MNTAAAYHFIDMHHPVSFRNLFATQPLGCSHMDQTIKVRDTHQVLNLLVR